LILRDADYWQITIGVPYHCIKRQGVLSAEKLKRFRAEDNLTKLPIVASVEDAADDLRAAYIEGYRANPV
jgi:hypothetical protein